MLRCGSFSFFDLCFIILAELHRCADLGDLFVQIADLEPGTNYEVAGVSKQLDDAGNLRETESGVSRISTTGSGWYFLQLNASTVIWFLFSFFTF